MAITVVLAAVFIPSALQPGASGIIYKQFALTIAVSMLFSALLALSFTPALCASFLQPEHEKKKNVVYRKFNRLFDWTTHTYTRHVGVAIGHAPRWMLAFVVVALLGGFLYTLADQRLGSFAGSSRVEDLPTVLSTPLSEPLFILGTLFILLVFFVPGGLASLPARLRGLRPRREPLPEEAAA